MAEAKQLNAFRVISIITLLCLGVVGGNLPRYIATNERLIRHLNAAAGGIFFAGAICHLLPDAVENAAFRDLDSDFPFPFFVFGIGTMLIMVMESVALSLKGSYNPLRTYDHDHSDEAVDRRELMMMDEADDCLDSTEPNITPRSSTSIPSIVLFCGLSFHSVMAGLALGAAPTPAWDIFVAIVAHKGLAAFALGVELLQNPDMSIRGFAQFIAAFSLMTPAGILVGAYAMRHSAKDSVVGGVCTSLAGGTFLFVALIEILSHELRKSKDRISICFSFVVGYSFYGMLAIWT